jgi:hypothetical protein
MGVAFSVRIGVEIERQVVNQIPAELAACHGLYRIIVPPGGPAAHLVYSRFDAPAGFAFLEPQVEARSSLALGLSELGQVRRWVSFLVGREDAGRGESHDWSLAHRITGSLDHWIADHSITALPISGGNRGEKITPLLARRKVRAVVRQPRP